MIKKNYIKLKIKLKSIKKFIIAELPNEKYIDEFIKALKCEGPIVRYGQIVFYKNEFIYAEYEEKTKIKLFKKREK